MLIQRHEKWKENSEKWKRRSLLFSGQPNPLPKARCAAARESLQVFHLPAFTCHPCHLHHRSSTQILYLSFLHCVSSAAKAGQGGWAERGKLLHRSTSTPVNTSSTPGWQLILQLKLYFYFLALTVAFALALAVALSLNFSLAVVLAQSSPHLTYEFYCSDPLASAETQLWATPEQDASGNHGERLLSFW